MILTGPQIKEEVEHGSIEIAPFSSQQLNPNSYNYRLAPTLYEVETPTDIRAASQIGQKIVLGDDGYLLQPQRLYLGSTVEKIGFEQIHPFFDR